LPGEKKRVPDRVACRERLQVRVVVERMVEQIAIDRLLWRLGEDTSDPATLARELGIGGHLGEGRSRRMRLPGHPNVFATESGL
jgi:hypothetical protein